jgi:predicted Zn-dependent protease
MTESLHADFHRLECAADFWSLRVVDERAENYCVRKNVPQPPSMSLDRGAMLTVYAGGGYGYAATSDLSRTGLQAALDRAAAWAKSSSPRSLIDSKTLPRPALRGSYSSPASDARPWSRREWYDLLAEESRAAGCDPRIVDWEASVETRTAEHVYLTSEGGEVSQRFRFVMPNLTVTAHSNGDTQMRTLNGYRGLAQQGGEAMLERFGYVGSGARVADQALQLLAAPNCPQGVMDALLLPDQMVLQIHESIGHPLELDRILGDERNFAGTSFVTLDMFGSYRYGSELLNVTFDPTRREELASYAFDDDGTPAERAYLIRGGILERPLGGAISQTRAGVAGVANARADGWNRPPIDRMANLNIEPGESTMEQMIAGIEHGVAHEHQQLVVDRRFAQQVPVRLRMGPADRRRQAHHRGQESQLPRHLCQLLAQPQACRRRIDAGSPWHAVLRQGRAIAADPRRTCLARMRVLRGRRIRR